VRVQSVTLSGNTALNVAAFYKQRPGGAVLHDNRHQTPAVCGPAAPGASSRFRNTVLQNPGYANCDGDGTAITDDGHNYAADTTAPCPAAQPDR